MARALLLGTLAALAAGVHPDEDSVSLLQLDRSVLRSRASEDKCLLFMHNPRTGGTTIDSMNLNLPRGHRAFQSLMQGPLDKAAGGPIWTNYTPGQLFDEAHGAELTDESATAAAEMYGKYIPHLGFRFVSWQHDGYTQTCQDLHTPPVYDEQVREFFSQPGCTTFCSVRDPMTRLLSAYKFRGFGACTDQAFEDWILATLPLREPISYCHVYPQIEYVYNAQNKSQATHQWCQRIIRFEHFEEDFNAVMEAFDKPLRLGEKRFLDTSACKVDHTAISQEAKDRVYETYRADYEAFGYPHP